MPGAAADSTSLAHATSTSCEREFITAGSWTSPPDYHGNPFAPGGVGAARWLVFEPLFVYVPASGETIPRLGVSFEQVTDTFTVTLQTNAFWHDGTPFTSKDVWSTFMLGYLYGWSTWDYLDTIETPDDYTIVFHWETPTILGKQFMGRRIICAPYHLYGTWADLVGPAMGDEAALDAIRQNLEAFEPAIPTGTGPFQTGTVAETEMILTKFSQHYSADNVDFDKVKIVPWTSNEWIKLLLETGQIDAAHPGLPEEEVNEILAAQPTMEFALPSDLAEFSLLFNLRGAPLSEQEFREAIAHAINRDEVREASYPYGLTDDTYATGVLPSFTDQWLSADFLGTLTTYEYYTTEAESLLTGLGYTRGTGGFWQDSGGNPLTFTITVHSGYLDWVAGAENIATQLITFGISTTVNSVPGWEYWGTLNEGEYQMAIDWAATWWHFAHPWAGYNRMFVGGTAQRVGFPEEVEGPEGETINLPDLVAELGATSDPDRQRELVETLAWVANEYLPQLPYLEKRLMIFHLDRVRVTNWPDNDDPIWSVAPGGIERLYATLMTEGRIRSYPFCIFLPTVLKNAGGP
jgi:peptide/nickel transport system substrate-binding protein